MNLVVVSTLVLAGILSLVEAKTTPFECYECITTNPSWSSKKCTTKKTCGLGNFCAKVSFGNSLVIRSCAVGGTLKDVNDNSKICKKITTYMNLKASTDPMKKSFLAAKAQFDLACVGGAGGIKTPKKINTCSKKLCNAGGRPGADAFVVSAGVVAVLLASLFRF